MSPGADLDVVAAVLAEDLRDGDVVNLGIGLPTMVASHIPRHRDIVIHSENGILGVAPYDGSEPADPDLIDAGKRPVLLRKGGSYLSHVDSFALVRGGHLDVAIMGARQISAHGDLANWWDGTGIPGVGGAMDLVAAAPEVFVFMRHAARDGSPKIVQSLTLPATGHGVVSRIYTEYGVFGLRAGTLVAHTLVSGCELAEVRAATGIPVETAASCRRIPPTCRDQSTPAKGT